MVSFASSTDGGEQIIAEQDRTLLIILGLNGVIGPNVLFNVEPMALKIDLELATLPKRVDIHVHPRCNLIPKLVTMDHAQLMEDGVIGVSGVNARFHVEVGKIPEHVLVTTLHQNMVAPIALVTLPKQDLVTKTLAQLMVDSASGMNGQHALLSVAVEIKQGQDDVTTLFQNSVVWSVMETLLNVNVATWIHVHHLVQLNDFKKFQFLLKTLEK